jgi:hypothetical protein
MSYQNGNTSSSLLINILRVITFSQKRINQHIPIYGIIFIHGKKASENSF